MKYYCIILLLVIASLCVSAQTAYWEWATTASGTLDEQSYSIVSDAAGNVYIAGNFSSPGLTLGNITLTNTFSPQNQIFVAKYNAAGNVVWANNFGGADYDVARDVATDAEGNVYVTGSYRSDSITFGTTTLTQAGGGDMFLSKLDSLGNVLWATGAGAANYDEGISLTAAANGDIIVAGYFRSFNITFGTTQLNNGGQNTYLDAFVVKYNAAGNVVWAKRFGGSTDELPADIAADRHGNVFVTGSFDSQQLIFGTDTLWCWGQEEDMFLVKYDSTGNVSWVKSAGGQYYDKGWGIAADSSGNAILTGYFNSHILAFDTFTFTYNMPAPKMFVVKYAADGSVLWAKGNTSGYGFGKALITDADENIYVAGNCLGATHLVFGNDSAISAGDYDKVVMKLDAQGNTEWMLKAGGAGRDEANAIALGNNGSVYISGYTKSAIDTVGNIILNNIVGSDAYVAKISVAPITTITEKHPVAHAIIYPNPSTDFINIELKDKPEENDAVVSVYNTTGQLMENTMLNITTMQLDLCNLESGIYFLEIVTGTDKGFWRIIKQ